jgi:hypothetical protein
MELSHTQQSLQKLSASASPPPQVLKAARQRFQS